MSEAVALHDLFVAEHQTVHSGAEATASALSEGKLIVVLVIEWLACASGLCILYLTSSW